MCLRSGHFQVGDFQVLAEGLSEGRVPVGEAVARVSSVVLHPEGFPGRVGDTVGEELEGRAGWGPWRERARLPPQRAITPLSR